MAANRLCVYGNTHCIVIYKNDYMTVMEETGSSKKRKDLLIVKMSHSRAECLT